MNPWLKGIASIFDFTGQLAKHDPETQRILRQTDAETMNSDWEAVTGDFNRAFEKVRQEVDHEPDVGRAKAPSTASNR